MNMNSQTRCVFYAYPSSTYGGKAGGWISATYKNCLATDPIDRKFFDQKDDAIKHAENTYPNFPWDKYRHCQQESLLVSPRNGGERRMDSGSRQDIL